MTADFGSGIRKSCAAEIKLEICLKCQLGMRTEQASDKPVIESWLPSFSLSPPRTLQLPAGSPLHNPLPLLLHCPPNPLMMDHPPGGPLDLPHRALLAHHGPPHPIVLWVLAPLNPHLHPSCHKERTPRWDMIPDLVGRYLSWCRRRGWYVHCAAGSRGLRGVGPSTSCGGVAGGCHPHPSIPSS